MPFLDCQTNFTGTVYTTENLEFARSFLTQTIRLHDPSWLEFPRGILGTLWMREDVYAVCRLIQIASVLETLRHKITQPSLEILKDKFNKQLLSCCSEKQFDETLTELQIAGALSNFVSPLEFEPLVPKDANEDKSEPPRSADFGIRLPGGDVHIDATVFHLGILNEWEKSMQIIKDRIRTAVKKKSLLRSVELRFPLICRPSDVEKFLPDLIKKITTKETGSEEISFAGRKGRVKWQPLLNLPWNAQNLLESSASLDQLIPAGTTAAVMGVPSSAIHFAWDLPEEKEDNNDEEVLYKSLRNSLRGKRGQFSSEETQNLIAVKLGHYKLIKEGFISLLNKRIWSNNDFRFLTGLIIFQPCQGYQESDFSNLTELVINPNAYRPASQALISLFEKQEQYHSEPANSVAYNKLGETYESQGDIENAIESYKKSLALESKQPTIHNILGILLGDQGDLEGAISAFHEATKCDPSFSAAYSNLGIVHRLNGNSKAAISAFEKSLEIDPNDAKVLTNLGATYSQISKYIEAVSIYERCIAANPEWVTAYINMGISQANLGRIDASIIYFEQALEIAPELPVAKQYLTEAKQFLAATNRLTDEA